VPIDTDFLPNPRYLALRIDQVRAALNPHGFLSVHVLLPPSPIFLRYFMALVGQQRKIQGILVPEFRMRRRRVGTDPQDDGSELFESLRLIAKRTGLLGASWRFVLGIKLKDHRGALEIRKLDFLALSIRKSQRGRFGSYFEPIGHKQFPFESFGFSLEFFPTRNALEHSELSKGRKSPKSSRRSVETRQIFSRILHASVGNLVAKWFFDPLNYI